MAFTRFFFRVAQRLAVLIEQALPTLRGQAFLRMWGSRCAEVYRRLDSLAHTHKSVQGPHSSSRPQPAVPRNPRR